MIFYSRDSFPCFQTQLQSKMNHRNLPGVTQRPGAARIRPAGVRISGFEQWTLGEDGPGGGRATEENRVLGLP